MENPISFMEGINELTDELAALLIRKQEDYGPANILEFGEQGLLIRANDKMQRLKTLILKGYEPNNEGIEDTWNDLAGYALLALALRKGYFQLPFRPKVKE